MRKSCFLCSLILLLCLITNTAFAQRQLRSPQGRLGNSYKTEKYNPVFKTNISQSELANILTIEKNAEKNRIKEEQAALKAKQDKQRQFEEQIRQETSKQKAEQQAFLKAEKDKQKQLEEQKKQEIAKQKEEQQAFLKAEKDKQKQLEEQKKQEVAKQKAEQQAILKAEQDKQKQLAEQKKLESAKQKEEQRTALKAQQEQQKLLEKQKKIEANKVEVLEDSEEQIAKAKESAIKTKLIEKPQPPKEDKNPKTKFIKTVFDKPVNNNEENTLTKNTNEDETSKQKTKNLQLMHKQDPSTKAIVKEISEEILSERPQMLDELSLLWVSAVQKSDTVYFAIIKLSNPDGEEVNKSGVKKILQPVLSAAPLVGQAFVNPALSAGTLIGSNVMGTMVNDSATKRLTKVNDADLVILARSIDELQETLLMNYLAYKNALKEYELSIKIADSRKEIYEKLNEENSPDVILANTFYTEALDNQYKARQEFLMKRVVLEQMVGADALNEMEKKSVSVVK